MSKKFKIGIDYGGTKIEGILLDEFGKIIERKRVNYEKNYQSSLHAVFKLIKDLENLIKSQCTVGIGIPGFSSKETGLINNSNAIWLNNKSFKKDLENLLKKKVRIMNDANCFTLSESIDGAGQNYKGVFGIIIGTGLGAGLSFNKQIIEGVNQVAGDWGHQPLPYPNSEEINSDIKCSIPNCGRTLCSEQFISGVGFEKNFNKKYNTQYKASEIVKLDSNGDKKANEELSLYEDRLSRLIGVMIGIFDPEVIILGGGMSNVDRLYKNIPKIIPKYTFSDKVRNKVLKNKHGDSSGVRGAAWLWNE
jgi:fructokinase